MPEIELESLVWLVWGGSLVGLQSSISILLNLKKKKLLSIIGPNMGKNDFYKSKTSLWGYQTR